MFFGLFDSTVWMLRFLISGFFFCLFNDTVGFVFELLIDK